MEVSDNSWYKKTIEDNKELRLHVLAKQDVKHHNEVINQVELRDVLCLHAMYVTQDSSNTVEYFC